MKTIKKTNTLPLLIMLCVNVTLMACQPAALIKKPQTPTTQAPSGATQSPVSQGMPLESEPAFASQVLLEEPETLPAYPSDEEMERLLQSGLVEKYNDMGIRLLNYYLEKKPNESIVVSPLSIGLAFALLYNGTEGEVRAELADFFGGEGLEPQAFNELTNILWRALPLTIDHNPTQDQDIFALNIANSIWAHHSTAFLPDFVKQVNTYYQARINRLDMTQYEASAEAINHWVSQRTNSLIETITSPAELEQGKIELILINALYLKARWQESQKFNPTRTSQEPFYSASGKTQTVDMMRQRAWHRYWESPDKTQYLAQSLNFNSEENERKTAIKKRSSSPVEVVFVLPPVGVNTEEQARDWSSSKLLRSFNEMQSDIGIFELPRFEQTFVKDIEGDLKKMGVTKIFGDKVPGITRMTVNGRSVSRVKHSVKVKMEEEGVEAAAITAILGPFPSTDIVTNFRFVANRPFSYFIRDKNTGIILFMGILNEVDQKIGNEND
jgi:serine protease inhibitor